MASGKVAYTQRDDFLLALPIPIDKATNIMAVSEWEAKKAVLEQEKKFMWVYFFSNVLFSIFLFIFSDPKDIVRPRIPLSSCLEAFAEPEIIGDFFSSAIQAQTTAKKCVHASTLCMLI
jgi:ubiquitin carboxyl-terminal hydrolase 5/13